MSADAETRAILEAAGASRIVVEPRRFGWLVACDLGAGCSSDRDGAFDTPQEVARHIVACARRARYEPPPTPVEEIANAGVVDMVPDRMDDDDVDVVVNDAGDMGSDDLAHPPDEQPADAEWLGGGDGSFSDFDVDRPVSPPGVSGGYAGITILPDELGARRNAVLAAITARKVLLLDVAADSSRYSYLSQQFAEYQNTGALGLPISAQLEANYREFLAMKHRHNAIIQHAAQCERAALDADYDGLALLAEHFNEGWP